MQINLRTKARQADADPIIAQRIKRLPSIRAKLIRFDGMDLARMQDIGGCRAIVGSVDTVMAMREDYLSPRNRSRQILVREDDYIYEKPKPDGYRGVHLIYRYLGGPNQAVYNGMKVEIQIRTRLQHAWATSVETVDTFTRQSLKSDRGHDDWQRFFALMGCEIAFREGTPPIPGTSEDRGEIRRELRRLESRLKVIERLRVFGGALQVVESEFMSQSYRYYLLELNIDRRRLSLRTFASANQANDAYGAVERSDEGADAEDVVLVAVESLTALRRAYPNYFLDTTVFLELVAEAIK